MRASMLRMCLRVAKPILHLVLVCCQVLWHNLVDSDKDKWPEDSAFWTKAFSILPIYSYYFTIFLLSLYIFRHFFEKLKPSDDKRSLKINVLEHCYYLQYKFIYFPPIILTTGYKTAFNFFMKAFNLIYMITLQQSA